MNFSYSDMKKIQRNAINATTNPIVKNIAGYFPGGEFIRVSDIENVADRLEDRYSPDRAKLVRNATSMAVRSTAMLGRYTHPETEDDVPPQVFIVHRKSETMFYVVTYFQTDDLDFDWFESSPLPS
jgi:hypothetical protein